MTSAPKPLQHKHVFRGHVNISCLPHFPLTPKTSLHPSPASPRNLLGRTHICLLPSHRVLELDKGRGDTLLQSLRLWSTVRRGPSICSCRMGSGLGCTYTFLLKSEGAGCEGGKRGKGKVILYKDGEGCECFFFFVFRLCVDVVAVHSLQFTIAPLIWKYHDRE